ncbi:MAG: hypothetical protein IT244_02145, partial [Bacteroidia bacterium]|nr:hypothetical protein [Bacteroidia bacterium]
IVSNILKIGNKGYWKNIAYTTMQTRFTVVDSVNQTSEVTHWNYGENATTRRVGIHSLINYKWNSRISSRSGIMVSYLHSDLRDSFRNGETVRTLREFKGGNVLSQAYTQLKWQLGKGMVLVPGVYSQYWAENNAVSLEPRLGYKWNLGKKLSISSGAGFHAQMQPMEIYYTKIWDTTLNKYRLPNTQLGFSNAKHIAAGIEFLPGSSMRFKVESYFQQLGKVPVSVDASSNLSLSNWGADFGGLPSFDSLVNEGKGRNYGIEITLERFFSKGFYWLFTTSIFDSKYAMQDGVYKNSAWNGGWVINALAGYDWVLGKNKNNVITFNAKVNSAGGRRYTPVDVAATETDGNLVRYDWKNPFSQKFEDYFRVDFRIGFKRNGKKITQEWAVDLQNLTNHQNALSKSWDFNRKQVVTDYQQGFFPMVTYRILF